MKMVVLCSIAAFGAMSSAVPAANAADFTARQKECLLLALKDLNGNGAVKVLSVEARDLPEIHSKDFRGQDNVTKVETVTLSVSLATVPATFEYTCQYGATDGARDDVILTDRSVH